MKFIYSLAIVTFCLSMSSARAQEPSAEEAPPVVATETPSIPMELPPEIAAQLSQLQLRPVTQAELQKLNLPPQFLEVCRLHEVCNGFLPPEDSKSEKKPIPTKFTAEVGGAAQSTTGAGVQMGIGLNQSLGKIRIRGFQLPDPRLKLNGSALVGSTASDQSNLPALQVSAAVTVDHPELAPNPVNAVLFGKSKQRSEAGVMFDRNIALGRTHRTSLYAGTASIFGEEEGIHPDYISFMPMLRAGVGMSNDYFTAFANAGLKIDGKTCPFRDKSNIHAFCVDGTVLLLAGPLLPEANAEIRGGANYQYTVSNDPRNAIKSISIGPELRGEAKADISGTSQMAAAGLVFKVQ